MNTALGIIAAVVSIAAFLVVLKMLFRGLVVLVKLAGFATLSFAAAYATLHTAELTDPDLGGLKGVYQTARQNVSTTLDELPRVKVSFKVEQPEGTAIREALKSVKF